MNIKRLIAVGLAALWLLGAHFGSHEDAYVVGTIVSNVWLATLLLLPREAKK